VAGIVLEDKLGGESLAKEFFSRTVVGGGIEGADAGREGVVDDGCCGESVRVGVVLGVEGCRAAYQRWED
jgi:hypothetical protein